MCRLFGAQIVKGQGFHTLTFYIFQIIWMLPSSLTMI